MLCDHQAIKTIKEMVCILSVHPIDHRLAIRSRVDRIARESTTEEDSSGRVYSANFFLNQTIDDALKCPSTATVLLMHSGFTLKSRLISVEGRIGPGCIY